MKRKFIIALGTMVLGVLALGSCGAKHEHSFGTSWEKDATHHWHECEGENCSEISGKAEHTGGEATETEQAKCEVCGESYGSLKEHEHAFTVSKVDPKYLVSAADCDSKAVYYKSCACGEKGSETFESGEALGHKWSTDYSSDGTQHWHECTVEGCDATDTKENHSGGTASETSKAVCEKCGQAYGEKLPHTHVYDQEKVEAKYLVSEADCDSKAVYYKSCACGEKGSDTFESGDVLGHDMKTKYDATHHWQECDRVGCEHETPKIAHSGGEATCLEKAVCTGCGQSYGELEEHVYGEWKTKTPADCENKEVEHRVCTIPNCGHEETRDGDPALGHSWDYDSVRIETIPSAESDGTCLIDCANCEEHYEMILPKTAEYESKFEIYEEGAKVRFVLSVAEDSVTTVVAANPELDEAQLTVAVSNFSENVKPSALGFTYIALVNGQIRSVSPQASAGNKAAFTLNLNKDDVVTFYNDDTLVVFGETGVLPSASSYVVSEVGEYTFYLSNDGGLYTTAVYPAVYETFYLRPSSEWKSENAWFAVYSFNSNNINQWASLTDEDGDGVYEGSVDVKNHEKIIFVRMNPASDELGWDNMWSQTSDLVLKDAEGNCWEVSGWNEGAWANYVPHTHTYGEWETKTPADCENPEILYRVCSDPTCLDEETKEGEPALGHNYTGAYVDNEDGTHSRLCVNGCNTKSEGEGHTSEEIPAIEATCTEVGYTAGSKCLLCEAVLVAPQEVPVKEHNYGAWIDKETTQERECADCHHIDSRDLTDVWDKVTVSSSLVGEGSEANPYLVESGADLAYVKDNAASLAGKYLKLTRNIDVDGYNFIIPSFGGIFDGNDYSIKGLAITGASNIGLFGETSAESEIKNLTAYGSINSTGGVVGLVGLANGKLTNLTSYLTVSAHWCTGGIAGQAFADVTNCINHGAVTGESTTGGIVGEVGNEAVFAIVGCKNYGTITGTWSVGGITGHSKLATIDNCENHGAIIASGNSGGIAGETNADITNSKNFASVTTTAETAGGIVGNVRAGSIKNSNNEGNVIGKAQVGGIVGAMNGTSIENCINSCEKVETNHSGSWSIGGIAGITSCNIIDCVNNSAVKGTSGGVGGIAGELAVNKNIRVEGCLNTGNITAPHTAGGITGYGRNNIIDNCENTGSVTGTHTSSWAGSIGGIAGVMETNGEILNSTNSGTISNVVGNMGGIVGTVAACKITNCENTGSVTASNGTKVGGIVGSVTGNGTISGCTNSGEVKAKNVLGGITGNGGSCSIIDCENTGNVTGSAEFVGGIAGQLVSGATLKDTTNYGTVIGTNHIAGLVGKLGKASETTTLVSTITNCINEGEVRGSAYFSAGLFGSADTCVITGCTNKGEVNSTADCVGGLVAALYSGGTIENCSNEGNLKATTNISGLVDNNQGTIKNSTNKGTITLTSSSGVSDGICRSNSGTITECSNEVGTI